MSSTSGSSSTTRIFTGSWSREDGMAARSKCHMSQTCLARDRSVIGWSRRSHDAGRGLVQGGEEPLVVERAEIRRHGFAEMQPMRRPLMGREIGFAAPHRVHREVIGAGGLLEYVVAQVAGIAAGLCHERPQ